jgi:hypothetical protein
MPKGVVRSINGRFLSERGLLAEISDALHNAPKIPVESECVASLAYDVTSNELTVEFNQRGTYKYSDVPLDEYANFQGADSKGAYFNLYIRDQYSYERVG